MKPIQFSSISQILGIDSQKLRRWYKEVLSGFVEEGKLSLHEHDTEFIDEKTGEIKDIFVPLCFPENIGDDMCIDETMIGETFFTIISNRITGKLAFMAEATNSLELTHASFPIKKELEEVKILNRDLANSYRKFSNIMMPNAKQVVDNFHVIKLLFDGSQSVRMSIKRKIDTEKRETFEAFKTEEVKRKELCKKEGLKYIRKKYVSKEKTLINGEKESEILRRSRFLLYKFRDQWTDKQSDRANVLFSEYPKLEKAYDLTNEFRNWFSKKNIGKKESVLKTELKTWYKNIEDSVIKDLKNFKSTVERNQEYILNYFSNNGASNAMAENRNSKIKKFINSNQGTRDRDFFFFRLKIYFT